MQGYHRGFYNNPFYEISEQCLDKEFTLILFYYNQAMQYFSTGELVTIAGLVWNMWYNIDYSCEIEGYLYDLSMFCFDHDCSFQALSANWMSRVFQVTATMNSFSALYYDIQPEEGDHLAIFEFWSEMGTNIGKLIRYCLDFDSSYVNEEAGLVPRHVEEMDQ